jgi:hypothetical protein
VIYDTTNKGVNMTEIDLVDEKAFAKAVEDNEPYNLGWFEKNANMLHTFISYYESCKQSTNPNRKMEE